VPAAGAVLEHHAEALARGSLGALEVLEDPLGHLREEHAIADLLSGYARDRTQRREDGANSLCLHGLHGEHQAHGPGLLQGVAGGCLARGVRCHQALQLAAGGASRHLDPRRLGLGGDHRQQLAGLGPPEVPALQGPVQGGQLGQAPPQVGQPAGLAGGEVQRGLAVVAQRGVAQGEEQPAVCHLGQEQRQVALGSPQVGVGTEDAGVEVLGQVEVAGDRVHGCTFSFVQTT